MEAEFFYEIEHTDWVSPIVVVPKKNGKLRVCMNLKKVNATTIRDSYPLPITDHVINKWKEREFIASLTVSRDITKFPLIHRINIRQLLPRNGVFSRIG